jgi:tetratricopeptide (TPR) repeat protein
MRLRIPALAVAAVAVLVTAVPAFAQNDRQNDRQPDRHGDRWMDPPSNAGKSQRVDRTQNLDFLFEALKLAPNDETAKAISDRIWGVWLNAGGDTTNLLITRVRSAIESKDLDLALQLLDGVVEFKPEYVEGWNQRATVYYLKKDYSHALADLAQVLSREPRHFGALFGVGVIMQEFGDDKRALDLFRRALALDPHMKRVPDLVKTLTEKVEGRDI